MMEEPILEERVAQMRHQDLLREADLDRLYRGARITRPGVWDRLLLSVGDLLISLGTGLQRLSSLAAGGEASLPARRASWEGG